MRLIPEFETWRLKNLNGYFHVKQVVVVLLGNTQVVTNTDAHVIT
jgi:hypothetical protein